MAKLDYTVALKILLEHSVNFNKKQYEVLIQNAKKNDEIEHTKLESQFIKNLDIACLCFSLFFFGLAKSNMISNKIKKYKASKKTITVHLLLLVYVRSVCENISSYSKLLLDEPKLQTFQNQTNA